jgi:hypothetical protein
MWVVFVIELQYFRRLMTAKARRYLASAYDQGRAAAARARERRHLG